MQTEFDPYKKKELIMDFMDHDGNRYVFCKDNYLNHCAYHKEIRDPDFLNEIVKKTIIEPTFIYRAYKSKNRFCFYYLQYIFKGQKRYTKVMIVKVSKKLFEIVTIFRPGIIKEEKYNYKPLCKRP